MIDIYIFFFSSLMIPLYVTENHCGGREEVRARISSPFSLTIKKKKEEETLSEKKTRIIIIIYKFAEKK